ncbi:hypothetical protein [Mucilaginibacter celer]|uniref:Uncharacterized protein n=1 Tax=Mucilaginibacter celer TaxID=2305508 RepID=A0A494VQW6_9SPHI|nr:hypothetical protein [Mucilaginibacter celer]AYL97977.1 hypothetical protein HYN43_022980 [Mucilaginibacter celer]
MENLPNYINIVFILTTLLTMLLLFKAGNYSKPLIIITTLWLAVQAIIGLSGFYTISSGVPPRFMLLLAPPVILITVIFFTKKGKELINNFSLKTLTLLHIVRIPVELVLYWLYLHKAVPQVMTFEGHNFDILCGLSAPFIYYFGFIKKVLSKRVLMAWNIICMLLLANIVITAVLSAPFRFQQFGFEQPNIALFYFPFVWLPAFVVPAVLFAHLVAVRRLAR